MIRHERCTNIACAVDADVGGHCDECQVAWPCPGAAGADSNCLGRKVLDDGRELVVWPRLWGKACLNVGEHQNARFYLDAWDYDTPEEALTAMILWDGKGEPMGWSRHPASGRRRPGGDPSLEYLRF